MSNPIVRSFNSLSGVLLALALGAPVTPAFSQDAGLGGVITTPDNPTELPVEIEVETGLSSLKQAPLWKEQIQLLEDPYLAPVDGSAFGPSGVERRPGFGADMPPLNVWPLAYNFLTAQPMRLKITDGEVNWDVPGPLFDPDEIVAVDLDPANPNVPLVTRTKIGALVACSNEQRPPGFALGGNPCGQIAEFAVDLGIAVDEDNVPVIPDGWLVVHNPSGPPIRSAYGYSCDPDAPGCQADSRIPPNGTIIAVPAVIDGVLYEADEEALALGEFELEAVLELEMPVNEEHFIENRLVAEELGKALFWDMQVGSDGVQACGTCHFHAGADNRTRNQLNPNTTGGDLELQLFGLRGGDDGNNNQDVIADDFPFHKLIDRGTPGEPLFQPENFVTDVNDVMSSMGVSRFTQFDDVVVGDGAFVEGTSPPVLAPDMGTAVDDPIPLMQGLRRVEPRNTPTMIAAAFNLDNFWDGRARFHFNGGSVFGQSDPFFHIFVDTGAALEPMTNPDEVQLESDDLSTWYGGDEPPRIKFSSLASQAVGPPLSDFEMAFAGRNWAKIGKKLLQPGVTPLANQLVEIDDSRLGRWSNQGGSQCLALMRPTAPGTRGLCTTYNELIELAFEASLFSNADSHLAGHAASLNNDCIPRTRDAVQIETDTVPSCDPFDGYVLEVVAGAADALDTDQFTQMEANFSLFFALAVQAYEQLLIPDDTPFDQFMDANPLAGNGIGQPGEQGVLHPALVTGLVDVG